MHKPTCIVIITFSIFYLTNGQSIDFNSLYNSFSQNGGFSSFSSFLTGAGAVVANPTFTNAAANAAGQLLGNVNLTNVLGSVAAGRNFSSINVTNAIGTLSNLYHNATSGNQTIDCIKNKFPSKIPGATTAGAMLSQAVQNYLTQCAGVKKEEQQQTLRGRISALFDRWGFGRKRRSIFSDLTDKLFQKCDERATKQLCTVMAEEFSNPNCKICNLVAMVMQSQQIKSCLCNSVHLSSLITNLEMCVTKSAAGNAFQQTLGRFISCGDEDTTIATKKPKASSDEVTPPGTDVYMETTTPKRHWYDFFTG